MTARKPRERRTAKEIAREIRKARLAAQWRALISIFQGGKQ